MQCEIRGCYRPAWWRVRKQANRDRLLNVCSKCRDELTAIHGWEIDLG